MQVDIPSTCEEPKGKDESEATMKEEHNSLIKYRTWELPTLLEGKKCGWLQVDLKNKVHI